MTLGDDLGRLGHQEPLQKMASRFALNEECVCAGVFIQARHTSLSHKSRLITDHQSRPKQPLSLLNQYAFYCVNAGLNLA